MAKSGLDTEHEVLSVVRSASEPLQAWDIQKRLKYTSGKLESALRRLEGKNAIVRKKVTRVTQNQEPRVVAFVWDRDFEAKDEVPTEIIEKEIHVPVPGEPSEQPLGFDLVHWFEALDPVENPTNPDEVVIPVKLTKFEAQLLAALPHVNPKYTNLTHFIQSAVTDELKRQKNTVKRNAIQYLIDQGTISVEYGKQLLGLNATDTITGGERDE
ncbi:MAG: hypothetical protein RBG13Loki_1283 [Promethearchaeota archaeon CR_4]|nr:MAG: hypothetical protein RBG13Loki_1283 [Candidatus Lokiarchaeota archaeon CR_4]